VTDRTVDVYILRLRQKIETPDGASFLRSVRGFGYSFEPLKSGTASDFDERVRRL
jgi:DNA-binding response OmpR family regulator